MDDGELDVENRDQVSQDGPVRLDLSIRPQEVQTQDDLDDDQVVVVTEV